MVERIAAEQLGMAIRVQRTRLKLSQEKIAELAGIERNYLSDIELGKRNVSLSMMVRLAQALGCSMSELFAEVGLKAKKR